MIVKKDKEEIGNYFRDASNFFGSADAVYFPVNAEEIAEVIKDANRNKFHVTVSGARTGLTGGAAPEGGVILSLEKMNKIIQIDRDEKFAIVQPGVFLRDLQNEVERSGLFYPPDPTERDSFLGGNAATNASGAKTFKYGPTRNFVEEIKVVLPDGETATLKRGNYTAQNTVLTFPTDSGKEVQIKIPEVYIPRSTKNAAGYYLRKGMDAIDLFIGAEGTLGVITEIKLKLINPPEKILSAVIFFNNTENTLDFIEHARNESYKTRKSKGKNGLDARGLEFFDNGALKFLYESYPAIPTDAKAAVWFEAELNSENEDLITDKWFDTIETFHGDVERSWFAIDKKDREKFKDFRHAVSANVADYISSKGLRKVGTDTAVEDKFFKEYYYYSVKLAQSSGINFIVYGHAGNSHLHLNFLPKDKAELEQARLLYKDLCAKAVEFNGTVSAEHGIGKIKREYFLMMYDEETVRKMAKIKKTLDKNLILNIGNIFEERFLRD